MQNKYSFNPPAWCKMENGGVKSAILKAAENVGAQIFMSASFTFRIDDFEVVQKFFKKHGKKELNDLIVGFCRKRIGEV